MENDRRDVDRGGSSHIFTILKKANSIYIQPTSKNTANIKHPLLYVHKQSWNLVLNLNYICINYQYVNFAVDNYMFHSNYFNKAHII